MKKYFFKHGRILFYFILLSIISVYANTKWALVTKDLVDAGVNMDEYKLSSGIVLALIVMIIIFTTEYVKKKASNTLFKKVSINLKNDVFDKMINRKAEDFNKTSSGEYISILMNDVETVKDTYIQNILGLIHTSIQLSITIYTLIKLDLLMGIVLIITSMIPLITPKLTEKQLSESKLTYMEKMGLFTGKAKDIFTGFSVIKSFNIQQKMGEEFSKINMDTESSALRYNNIYAMASTIGGLSSYISILACFIVGTYLTLKGNITIGVLVASLQLIDIISMGVLNLTYQIVDLKGVKQVKQKVLAILDEQVEHEIGTQKQSFTHSIEFKDVSFAYNDTSPVIKNINFTLLKGKKYAIVGQSGSGKSTLLKLLLRFQTTYEGSIKIDGIEIRDLNLNDLHSLIASVQQETYIFDTTILDNICLYNTYPNFKLQHTLKASRLTEIVANLPEGLNSKVGECGSQLSGGERQRIAIARGMITEPSVILLDESTSALDTETARKIEDELLRNMDLTALVITHKLIPQQLEKYDNILVMKDGELIETGRFMELMQKEGYFKKLMSMTTDKQS